MSSGRLIMRGRVFQGRAFAPWALAGRPSTVTGCVAAISMYTPGLRVVSMYAGGLKKGQAGC